MLVLHVLFLSFHAHISKCQGENVSDAQSLLTQNKSGMKNMDFIYQFLMGNSMNAFNIDKLQNSSKVTLSESNSIKVEGSSNSGGIEYEARKKEESLYQPTYAFAQDRQSRLYSTDLTEIEDKFNYLILKLPNDIERTKALIVQNIAETNMLGYTVVLAFFLGSFLDTIADLMINARSITDLITNVSLWFFIGYEWSYAAGFAGPFMFPRTFNGGDPYLMCSSLDFFNLVAESDLDFNIGTVRRRTRGELKILTEQLRVEFKSKLGCIVGKRSSYSEAEKIVSDFEKVLKLMELFQLVENNQISSNSNNDSLLIDQELSIIWNSLPNEVVSTYDQVTIERAYTAKVYFFVGLLNLSGAIFGILTQVDAFIDLDTLELASVTSGIPFNPEFLPNSQRSIGWGYSYSMTYFAFLEEADPGCGLEDFNNLNSRYYALDSIGSLMKSNTTTPAQVKYFVNQWRRDANVALHCLLTTEEGSYLSDRLDMFVNLVEARLVAD